MTCRRELCAALIALALAGCAKENAAPKQAARDPAIGAVLKQADAAVTAGRLAEAGQLLDQGLAKAPESPALWVAIARLRLRGGEHLTAIDAADRALALGPDHAPALLLRALMVRDAHGFAAALPWFEAALAADDTDPDIWAEYAATLGDGGRYHAMQRAVRRLAAIAPDNPRVPFLQAVLAARGGEYPLARSLLARSGMAARGVPAARQLDALINLAEGNPDSAAEILEGLAKRQPGNARVRELYAKALFEGGRAGDLIARFGAEAERSEASPYLSLLVARAYEQIGDRSRAAPLLARAYAGAAQQPTVLAVREGLPPPTAAARRAGFAGNWRVARTQTRVLTTRYPASADVAALAGDAALGSGDLGAGLAAYALSARARSPWPLTRKAAWAARRAGDPAGAEALLARQVAGEPDTASALVALAHARAAAGDWTRAALLLDHAIALGAGHDPALIGLRLRAAKALGRNAEARRFASLLANLTPRHLDKP
jgi:predicted Zn-dependent protease